jgi:hypothetical protein
LLDGIQVIHRTHNKQANILIDVAGQVIENNTSIPKLVIDDRPTPKN